MRLRHIACDAQSESGAAGIAITRGLQAIEGLEDPLDLLRWDARTLIANADLELCAIPDDDARAVAKLDGVADDVGDAPFQRLRLAGYFRNGPPLDHNVLAHLHELAPYRLEQQVDVDRLQRLLIVETSKERQRPPYHALHLVELSAEARLQRRVFDLCLDLQPQPRQGRL